MVQNKISLILLLIHLWISSSTAAWSSQDFCLDAGSARRATCRVSDPSLAGWKVDLDYSELGSTLTISYVDSNRSVIVNRTLTPLEVRMICHSDGDGTNQTEARVCTSDRFDIPETGGPYAFSNLSASGILPGWTCNISACFQQEDDTYVRTEVHSYNLPAIFLSTLSNNSTEAAAITVNNLTSGVIVGTESDNMHFENVNIYLPVLMTVMIIVLCAMLLTGTISTICIRRQFTRRRALLMYNKQSMVFDPHFNPAVCIDKPAFSLSPGMSVISVNLLHNLDPSSFYVKEDHLNEEQLSFETDTDNNDEGSINLSKSIVPTFIEKTRLNDDMSSTHTEVIADHSANLASSCPQSDSTCKTHSMISSEQGYVQLPHCQQVSSALPLSGAVTRLDCPSDDNDSVLTEVLLKDDQFAEGIETVQQDEKDSVSEYVQTQSSAFCTEICLTCENVQSSGFSMLTLEGMQSDSGYVQSSAVSPPLEYKDVLTNVLDYDLCGDDNQSLNHPMGDCQETSVYFHPANFHSALADYTTSGYQQNMLNHTNESDKAYMGDSHSNSRVTFHPHTKTALVLDNEIGPDSASESIRLEPSSSSENFTNSYASSDDYLPSELLTRKILVPASHDLSSGFVVHLDISEQDLVLRTDTNYCHGPLRMLT